ncbi:hypothetical protein BXY70_1321 [Roseovarius halotolerans]|uniref:Uncharacterized protein n=1 Tax=Roseovarius halotolerans TaxID=505353 RepID=A0A1X6Y5Q2_9RHOB|nr:hypothetical protein [Roseovarius halotolerans]RKT35288.1 hypothetical protein BXY70_1321 [Roseovarius halotolerans]SLN11212.1 hypothetical protein ROH8110_00075 [Roseovarius halotolerans]
MTLHQCLAFYEEGQADQLRQWRMQAHIARASHATNESFDRFIESFDPDTDTQEDEIPTIDFSKMD